MKSVFEETHPLSRCLFAALRFLASSRWLLLLVTYLNTDFIQCCSCRVCQLLLFLYHSRVPPVGNLLYNC